MPLYALISRDSTVMSRRPRFFVLLLLALAGAAAGTAAHSAPVRTERVEAELFAERAAAVPGKPATVGLRLRMDEHWHTYWRNPGDSGLPTRIRWTLPEGWSAGPIQWPYPEAQRVGPLMNYGYSDEVMLLVDLTPPAQAASGPVTVKADADWLVCKDICIPEKATLTLGFAVAAGDPGPVSRNEPLFARERARLPAAPAGWDVQSAVAGNKLTLRVMPPAGATAPAKVSYFPFRENFVDHPAPQALVRDGNGFRLDVKLVEPVASGIANASGVFVAESAWPGFPGRKAVELAMPVAAALPAIAVPIGALPGETGGSLALALVFALAGGLLLNLMPCVFPVLGIKVMGFVRHAHGNARALWIQGAVFSAGVLVSFLILAGMILAFRAAGTDLGWGFQLQSPAFVTLLAALFFLMALNLFGVFELGAFAQSMTSELSAKGRYADAFLAGVLATVVATPCTAPFMGVAVGFTLTQSATVSLAVFATLGAGMALPVLALSFFPKALKKLPKPGPWMETFKQVMGFPIMATVVYLVWLFGRQAGIDAVSLLLGGLVLIALGAWMYGRGAAGGGAGRSRLADAVAAALVVLGQSQELEGLGAQTESAAPDRLWHRA